MQIGLWSGIRLSILTIYAIYQWANDSLLIGSSLLVSTFAHWVIPPAHLGSFRTFYHGIYNKSNIHCYLFNRIRSYFRKEYSFVQTFFNKPKLGQINNLLPIVSSGGIYLRNEWKFRLQSQSIDICWLPTFIILQLNISSRHSGDCNSKLQSENGR